MRGNGHLSKNTQYYLSVFLESIVEAAKTQPEVCPPNSIQLARQTTGSMMSLHRKGLSQILMPPLVLSDAKSDWEVLFIDS